MRPRCPYSSPLAPPDVMAVCPGFVPASVLLVSGGAAHPLLTCRSLGVQNSAGHLHCVCTRPGGVPVLEYADVFAPPTATRVA